MPRESAVRIGLILPEVLGTYGDSGNAIVLAKRLQWRNLPAEIVTVDISTPVPSTLDVYLLGGGEDRAQTLAVDHLLKHPGMQEAVGRGAAVFAVCAALQILGTSFAGPEGVIYGGLGLLDVTTVPGQGARAVGELLTKPASGLLTQPLTGFENHQGHTTVGPAATPLGTVIHGIGNGTNSSDGAVQGHVVGTYLHGPALARNPELADLLLHWATGESLPPLEIPAIEQLRSERQRAVTSARR